MIFYLSGISDPKTYKLLEGITTDFLVDERDAENLPLETRIGVLDSGAYRLYKRNREIVLENYLAKTALYADRSERIVAPDVIGDFSRSLENYQLVKNEPHLKGKLMPVWGWNAPREYLNYYLSEAEIVGIGGLAEIFRADQTAEEKARREKVLNDLRDLCEKYPKRFHIFGLNYLKAIEILSPFLSSGDASVWLRGASRAFVIFVHSKNGHLTQAPARAIPQYAGLNREERCRTNAKNITEFVKEF